MILQFLAISCGHDMGKQPVVVALSRLQGFFSSHISAGQIPVSGLHDIFYRLSSHFIANLYYNTRLTILIGPVIIFH